MSVLPLMPASISGKWNMLSPTQLPYKMERPSYATPAPVENIPSNNECRMVEVRGSKVASFNLDGDEYICLPQAFELFLKHLVGGLHTVYTKLKRLNITPVVCNVEQVRILRGLGAIQPGVNRCKLITKGDFEILYQDCTTASRPGRPPKRYPLLLSGDMMSHQTNTASTNRLLTSPDSGLLHKRMRLSHSSTDSIGDRKAASPNDADKDGSAFSSLPADLHANPNNLAYLQVLRQQYQQASALCGLQNGLDVQQQAVNPALTQFLLMSNPGFFSSAMPPTSIAMLNHLNQQIAQSQQAASGVVRPPDENRSAENRHHSYSSHMTEQSFENREKDSDDETTRLHTSRGKSVAGIERSPSASSNRSNKEDVIGVKKTNPSVSLDEANGSALISSTLCETARDVLKSSESVATRDVDAGDIDVSNGFSSMHKLLSEVQRLLKMAASCASVHEKRSIDEIAELKEKLVYEKKLRQVTEQKLFDSEKGKAEVEHKLSKEIEESRKLHSQLYSMQRLFGHERSDREVDLKLTSPKLHPSMTSDVEPSNTIPDQSSPNAVASSLEVTNQRSLARSLSRGDNETNLISLSTPSPTSPHRGSSRISNSSNSPSNFNNNNSGSPDEQSSPSYPDRPLKPEQDRIFFSNPLLFQSAASQ